MYEKEGEEAEGGSCGGGKEGRGWMGVKKQRQKCAVGDKE